MNKQQLAHKVAGKTGFQKGEAEKFVDALIEIIGDTLASGEKVGLAGLVNWEVKDTNARKGRNPQTGEEIQIAASKRLSTKPLKALKDKITQ